MQSGGIPLSLRVILLFFSFQTTLLLPVTLSFATVFLYENVKYE